MVFKRKRSFSLVKRRKRFRKARRRRRLSYLPELKNHDTSGIRAALHFQAGAGGAAPTLYPLADINQGDTNNTRDGNTINPTKMSLKATITAPDTQDHVGSHVRFLVFHDTRPCPGTAPTYDDIVYSITNINSGINRETFKARFKVLYDKTKWIGTVRSITTAGQNYSTGGDKITFDVKVPMRKLPKRIFYDTTNVRPTGHGLFFFCVTEEDYVASGIWPEMTFYSRLYYRDP